MSVLSIPLIRSPIDTLKQLSESNTPVTSLGDTFKVSMGQSIDPILKKIYSTYQVHYDFDGAFKNMSEYKVVMGESSQLRGDRSVVVVPQCEITWLSRYLGI